MRKAKNFRAVRGFALGLALVSGAVNAAQAAPPTDRIDELFTVLDERVPALLLRYTVPSAAVAVVHDGRILARTWGLADVATARIATNQTRYNVASLSKLFTAWGVMRLVEEGKISLDDPVMKHLKRWRLPASEQNDGVTVRRLLSHTAGLSMPTVPWYGPGERVPTVEAMLEADPPLRILDRPGKGIRYSGGGYAVLQLLIEEVSGMSFEAYMQRRVLAPLGMSHSSFVEPEDGDATAAVPYDESGRPLPHYRFAASAAAGLYTTLDDLAAFAAASVGRGSSAPLPPATLAAMQAPVEMEEASRFRYGLGYSLLALPSGRMTAGHAGSNEGWTSIIETLPDTGDALVVLTNRSGAFRLYRDVMCEWLLAAAGESYPRFCEQERLSWTSEDTAFVDGLFASASESTPGAAVLVAIGDGVVHRKAYGSADLAARHPLTPETPFYLASLAKSLTAHAVLELVADGRMSLADPISRFVAEVPPWAGNATVEQLLSHTSGVPDYHGLIDWSRYDGMDNAEVLALLREKGKPLFEAGSRYAYSNSGYILLAMAVERCAGTSFADFLRRRLFDPLGMSGTTVHDGGSPAPPTRALAYEMREGKAVLSDYIEFTLPSGKLFPFRATTFGAGGMFGTVDDLHRMSRAMERPLLLPLGLQLLATSPRTSIEGEIELPDTKGHGFGWFLSRRGKASLLWNAGSLAGHKTILVRIPQYDATIILLANSAEAKPNEIALAIADRMLKAD